MCGIAGYFGLEEKGRGAVSRATEAQKHRGPDDGGVEDIGPGLVFGHRRLAILDLSPLGHQPMQDPLSGSWLVFNGEIYNFAILRKELESAGVRFRGHSDTEVLLYGLVREGRAFLPKLEGMFAFAFWNASEKQLLLARDPMGIKPLYYFQTEKEFGFASEIKALLAMGVLSKELCQIGLEGFLKFGAVQHPDTLWKGVVSLGPGEWMTVNRSEWGDLTIVRKQFWQFPEQQPCSEEEAIAFLQRELPRAVRDHLVADVPVGIFLSSGIDSTILAGLASEIHPGLEAFTVCFGDHKDFDEDRLAADTAKRFGLKHERIVISEREALDSFEGWLASMDQPSIDGLNTYIISKSVRARGIKVALSGLGADELFGGYPSFREIPIWRQRIRKIQWIPRAFRKLISQVLGIGRGRVVRGKMMDAICADGSTHALFQTRRGLFDNQWIDRLVGKSEKTAKSSLDFGKGLDPVRAVQQFESRIYMGNMLLRDTDVCSMAHGLEVRVPFLDQKMVNFAFSLPSHLISQPGKPGKFLLKKAFAKYLSDPVLGQAKRGFVLPFGNWYKGPLRSMVENRLNRLGYLDPEEVKACWDALAIRDEPSMASRVTALLSLTG